ncbi:hypothetical protein IPJ70_01810 [Candidatus Campbellbacteria bacterium]|nr:MAG: hypothetical protein IPJ70_01810 [Candidatus Campbellbacteria bacterium]
MSVLTLTIISVLLYSLFAIFLGRMGGKINENIGASIFTGLSAILPLLYYFYEKVVHKTSTVVTTSTGVIYAVLAGLAIAAWNVLVIIIFARGGNLSYVFPVIYGAGAIAIPSIVGWLFFKESLTLIQGGGIALILIGITMVIFAKL